MPHLILFRRRILHAFNLAIRFGACKMRRLNQALVLFHYCVVLHSNTRCNACNPAERSERKHTKYFYQPLASCLLITVIELFNTCGCISSHFVLKLTQRN